jgi:very-short-patch-repair endonuclease
VFEAGPRAFLDGVSSLVASGLRKFDDPTIRVSVPRGARVRRGKRLDIRQTRRWHSDDIVGTGVPRSRPAVAAVRGALWARSDKQAALVMTMAVQQGLVDAQGLGVELLRIRRDRRRRFLHAVVLDLLQGVRALGEAEFRRMCRRRGLPDPSRQVVRKGRNGTYYLDAVWDEWGVVVEIDGIHHAWAQNLVAAALRQNDVMLANARVLRLPLLGLRIAPDEFFAQIGDALRQAGWSAVA